MSGASLPHPYYLKFNAAKQKSANNLCQMDLNAFKNVSAEPPSSSVQSLNYEYFNNNPDYRKDIIVTAVGDQANGGVQKFEIFENISRSNKVIFTSKVILVLDSFMCAFSLLCHVILSILPMSQNDWPLTLSFYALVVIHLH